MVNTENEIGEGSKRTRKTGTKYTRYTTEQIEVLERIYAKCLNPNSSQRSQILMENPILSGIDHKQIKIWFQNRRCREKHKKENEELHEENQKLAKANRMLRQQNDNLMMKINPTDTTNDPRRSIKANPLQRSIIDNTNTGLFLLAEEAKAEFLSKAIGNSINWIPTTMLKLPRPSPFGAAYVSYSCIGVAARAWTVVHFEPLKIIEILKHRTSWSRDCKKLKVIAEYPMNSGGTIELIYSQYYAPSTMACARDFWTVRYTSALDDGSIVVCEKSISGSNVGPSSPAALEFVRGKRLASGYLIRQCKRGSSIQLIDHLDLEASSVPQMVRSLYESSEYIAQNIVCALHHIENLSDEAHAKIPTTFGPTPESLRSFGLRLSRGFNDGLNGLSDDGWTLMNVDSSNDIIMCIKQTMDPGNDATHDGVISVKTSLLLKNVSAAKLVKVLKERRSYWMNFNIHESSIACAKAGCFPFPVSSIHHATETTAVLGKTDRDNEVVEIVRFERLISTISGDLYHLQISSGLEDNDSGFCSELIIAPISRYMKDEAPLLSSGFRILSLDSKGEGSSSTNFKASNEISNVDNAQKARSLLVLVLQFPFIAHLQHDVAAMAKQYAQHVISCLRNICLELAPPGLIPVVSSSHAYSYPSEKIQISPNERNDHTTNEMEANPVMEIENNHEKDCGIPKAGLEIGPGLVETYRSMGIEAVPDLDSAMKSSEMNHLMELEVVHNYISNETYPVMRTETTPNLTDDINSIVAYPAIGVQMASSLANGMNSNEPYPDMGIEITPNETYGVYSSEAVALVGIEVAPDFTFGMKPMPTMGIEINPGFTYDVNSTGLIPSMGIEISQNQSNYASRLANLLCQSYRSCLGVDMLDFDHSSTNSVLERMRYHPYAILCFSNGPVAMCMYANQTALHMLETTMDHLLSLSADAIIGGCSTAINAVVPTIMQKGFAILPPGLFLSAMNRCISYEQAVAWQVRTADGSLHCLALAFTSWSYV